MRTAIDERPDHPAPPAGLPRPRRAVAPWAPPLPPLPPTSRRLPAGGSRSTARAASRSGSSNIYQDHGLFFGRVEPSSPSDDRSRKCTRCPDERRDQPIIGLVLIRNMRLQGDEYVGGDIVDPDTGWIYGCKFRLVDDGRELIMRGYFGISLFGRSQIWKRVDPAR
jgi:hypothetical protein